MARVIGVGGAAIFAGGPILAQDVKVNVTASNIKWVEAETAAPIETITREDIQQSGFQTISEVVRSITANSNSTIANEWSGFGYYPVGANANLNNPGIYNFIAPRLAYDIISENTQFDAKASRAVYKLDGGQMALAVGYEWRRADVNNPGVPESYDGTVLGPATPRASGRAR